MYVNVLLRIHTAKHSLTCAYDCSFVVFENTQQNFAKRVPHASVYFFVLLLVTYEYIYTLWSKYAEHTAKVCEQNTILV